MKKEWSRMWVKSVQPRKQRKYRHNAPLHIMHKFLSANLAPELRDRFEKRSMPVRKGDEVEVMRGSSKGLRGTVSRIDMKKSKVYIEEIKIKKTDGSEIMRPLQPSNLKIVKLSLDDKMRQAVIERSEKKSVKKPKKEVKPVEKHGPKKEGKEKKKEVKKAKPARKQKSATKRKEVKKKEIKKSKK
jgi:large subunit ribosomal protein L24